MTGKDLAGQELTERERAILANAWECFDNEPKVNYDKLAEKCGFTNPRSASNAWANIKKKLAFPTGNGTATTPGKATPKATTPKKRVAKADADEDEAEAETPTKKPRARKAKAKAKPVKEESKEESEEEVNSTDAVKGEGGSEEGDGGDDDLA
ncbi:hypothetical protein H2203_003356 [Taxawa tesnikishii (nom. ined.)]|nr:hypothetical protein H2203_003356 [Dothideales sp. JES 119]